jgi:hypothetical protein
MSHRWVLVSLAASIALAMPGELSAQQSQPFRQAQVTPKRMPPDPRLDVEELTPAQIQRAQDLEQPPEPPAKSAPKTAAPKTAQPARAVACSGAFAKESNHIKLASVYKSENVAFAEVDAGEGKTIMASVLFPKDPKRRLEVWWLNETARAGIYLVVINGQSTWSGPKGVRLGLQLAAIEKLNGKPVKLKGLNKDAIGMISDWQGGTLEQLPGGCRFGISFRPDPKAPADALTAVSGDQELLSTDASVRAVKPTISEILIGY